MEFLTLTKTIKILKEKNIDIKKHLGQHFLIDRNCRDKILSFAELKEEDIVVEIGPGLGALTDGIIEKVKEVYGFEIDEDFCEILDQLTDDYTALYINNATQSNNISDCIFWYKAPRITESWQFGCDEFWMFHHERFNKNYVPSVV